MSLYEETNHFLNFYANIYCRPTEYTDYLLFEDLKAVVFRLQADYLQAVSSQCFDPTV
jgi:hypothetical protein